MLFWLHSAVDGSISEISFKVRKKRQLTTGQRLKGLLAYNKVLTAHHSYQNVTTYVFQILSSLWSLISLTLEYLSLTLTLVLYNPKERLVKPSVKFCLIDEI